mmetsp:Transcript_46890/g.133763  ORF Transcript_46890/g.133763 Transcript_46890/m.133763 type:complete len:499 (+) Transcript_46890:79-1575(+)
MIGTLAGHRLQPPWRSLSAFLAMVAATGMKGNLPTEPAPARPPGAHSHRITETNLWVPSLRKKIRMPMPLEDYNPLPLTRGLRMNSSDDFFEWKTLTVGHSHEDREYLVSLPKNYEDRPMNRSVILLLHGLGLTPEDMWARFVALRDIPDAPILVSLKGLDDYGVPAGWHGRYTNVTNGPDGPLCGPASKLYGCPKNCGSSRPCSFCFPFFKCSKLCAWSTCGDDFGFIEVVLNKVMAEYTIDKQRVFLAGFSMGGMMAWDVASDERLGKRFTAIAVFAGSPLAGTQRANPKKEDAPWVFGMWGGKDAISQDKLMPPFSNIRGRPDKAVSNEKEFYWSTAENATRFWAQNILKPKVKAIDASTVLFPVDKGMIKMFNITCRDDGSNGAVFRCYWASTSHEVPLFGQFMAWYFFQFAALARPAVIAASKAAQNAAHLGGNQSEHASGPAQGYPMLRPEDIARALAAPVPSLPDSERIELDEASDEGRPVGAFQEVLPPT